MKPHLRVLPQIQITNTTADTSTIINAMTLLLRLLLLLLSNTNNTATTISNTNICNITLRLVSVNLMIVCVAVRAAAPGCRRLCCGGSGGQTKRRCAVGSVCAQKR